jgi:hypothetical protein
MIDRDALAREMLEAWKIDKGLPCEKAADIAIRHIAAARAEALEEAANLIDSVGFADDMKNQALTFVSEMIRYLAKTEPK